MSKKTKKDKEIAKLRRELEALRAQAKSGSRKQENKKTPKHPDITSGGSGQAKKQEPTAVVDVRADLRKTAILTVACLGILLLLSLTQSRWLLPF